MSEPVANMSEASKTPPVGAFDDYLLMRGLRYLSDDAKQRKKLFRQFLQLFTSAFKYPHVGAKHGFVWALDLRVIEFLISPVSHDLLPSLTLRIDIGSGVIPAITNPIPKRPDPSVAVIFSAELDEDFTVRLLCRHILGELLEAYDSKWPVWNGYGPGRNAPWLIGFIEAFGLLNNGVDLPLYVLEGLEKGAKGPRVANLFIDYECDCPEHFRPSPHVPRPDRRKAKRMEPHSSKDHKTPIEFEKCYICSPFSKYNREPNMNIVRDRMRLVKGEMMDEFSLNRARQQLISRDAEAARKGKQQLRPTATRATEAAKEEALKLTEDALFHAGFPVREMRRLFGPNGPPTLAETLLNLDLGDDEDKEKGKEKEKEKEEAKGKGKAKELRHVEWRGGPAPNAPAALAAPVAATPPTASSSTTVTAETPSANARLTKSQLRAAQRKAKKQRAAEEEKE